MNDSSVSDLNSYYEAVGAVAKDLDGQYKQLQDAIDKKTHDYYVKVYHKDWDGTYDSVFIRKGDDGHLPATSDEHDDGNTANDLSLYHSKGESEVGGMKVGVTHDHQDRVSNGDSAYTYVHFDNLDKDNQGRSFGFEKWYKRDKQTIYKLDKDAVVNANGKYIESDFKVITRDGSDTATVYKELKAGDDAQNIQLATLTALTTKIEILKSTLEMIMGTVTAIAKLLTKYGSKIAS